MENTHVLEFKIIDEGLHEKTEEGTIKQCQKDSRDAEQISSTHETNEAYEKP